MHAHTHTNTHTHIHTHKLTHIHTHTNTHRQKQRDERSGRQQRGPEQQQVAVKVGKTARSIMLTFI